MSYQPMHLNIFYQLSFALLKTQQNRCVEDNRNKSACSKNTHAVSPANSALCLMIFPTTSSRLPVDVVMLMRSCSDCSFRKRGFATFFQAPQICKQTQTKTGAVLETFRMQMHMNNGFRIHRAFFSSSWKHI